MTYVRDSCLDKGSISAKVFHNCESWCDPWQIRPALIHAVRGSDLAIQINGKLESSGLYLRS